MQFIGQRGVAGEQKGVEHPLVLCATAIYTYIETNANPSQDLEVIFVQHLPYQKRQEEKYKTV